MIVKSFWVSLNGATPNEAIPNEAIPKAILWVAAIWTDDTIEGQCPEEGFRAYTSMADLFHYYVLCMFVLCIM